jgi:hypothetical protein
VRQEAPGRHAPAAQVAPDVAEADLDGVDAMLLDEAAGRSGGLALRGDGHDGSILTALRTGG